MANNPRRHAYALLRSFNPLAGNLDQALNGVRAAVDNSTAGVVQGMCEDVLRHMSLVDHLIAQFSTKPAMRLERMVRAALRLGIVSYVRGDPDHAAVSETVNLLPEFHKARGLINAVMRRICETLTIRPMGEEEALALRQSPATSPLISETSMPWGDRFVIETELPFFPENDNARYKVISGFDDMLWKKLLKGLLPEELAQVCFASTLAPRVWFRMRDGRDDQVNKVLEGYDSIRRLDDDSTERFDGTSSETVEMRALSIGVNEREAGRLLHSTPFRTGGLTVQDYAAQLPARGLDPDEGEKIIDFCAAPGGKTLQLADGVGEHGRVVAFDRNEKKLKKIKQNLDRWAFSNTSGAFGDARHVELPECGIYDAVLVDAPCSNTGVMGRRLEARYRFKIEETDELVIIQAEILANAARHIRSGGRICYSTCSLLDKENGKLIRDFLEEQGGEDSGWEILDEVLTLPTPGGHDGGYYAVLRKP